MTARKQTIETKGEKEVEATETNGTAATPTVDLNDLMTQKHALDAAIKQAKLTAPTQSKLARVIEKQRQSNGDFIYGSLANQIMARIKAGQASGEAFDAVVDFWVSRTREEVARRLQR